MTNGRKKLYQWPVYRNSSTFFHKYSDQNFTSISYTPNTYSLYFQQIWCTTNIFYILNKYFQQRLLGMTNASGDKIYQRTINATILPFSANVQAISLKLESVFPTYTQEIYLIFSTNTFNNCLVGVTNGSEDEIYQGAIQATEKMHLLCKSFSQKTLNRKER